MGLGHIELGLSTNIQSLTGQKDKARNFVFYPVRDSIFIEKEILRIT